jgi:hypothetical protein
MLTPRAQGNLAHLQHRRKVAKIGSGKAARCSLVE